jgi:hypothetical protein
MLFLRAPVHTHLDMFISYTALIDVCTACIMLHVLSCPCVIFSGVIWKSEQSIRPIEKYQCLPINELTKAAAAHKHAVQVNTLRRSVQSLPDQSRDSSARYPSAENPTPSFPSISIFLLHCTPVFFCPPLAFVPVPHSPKNPPMYKFDAMMRWQGTKGAKGLFRSAEPTVE